MTSLSQRLVRLASLASLASLLCCAAPLLAQIPAFPPPPNPTGATFAPTPAAAAASSAPVEPAVVPPPAAAPDPSANSPALPDAPPPAKSEVITQPPRAELVDDALETGEADDLERQPRWYGWQTLAADGASLTGLVASGLLSGGGHGASEKAASGLAWLGVLSYEFTPGIVHFFHRNPGRGFASMGIRLALPLTGAFVGASVASGCNGFLCEADGAAVGLLLGMGSAIAIDAALFAYDDRERPVSERASRLTPVFSVTPQRAWLGLAGQL